MLPIRIDRLILFTPVCRQHSRHGVFPAYGSSRYRSPIRSQRCDWVESHIINLTFALWVADLGRRLREFYSTESAGLPRRQKRL